MVLLRFHRSQSHRSLLDIGFGELVLLHLAEAVADRPSRSVLPTPQGPKQLLGSDQGSRHNGLSGRVLPESQLGVGPVFAPLAPPTGRFSRAPAPPPSPTTTHRRTPPERRPTPPDPGLHGGSGRVGGLQRLHPGVQTATATTAAAAINTANTRCLTISKDVCQPGEIEQYPVSSFTLSAFI